MAQGEKTGGLAMFGWALKRLVTAPATWIGLIAGAAAGSSLVDISGMGGAIGFGSMVGVAVGMTIFGVTKAVQFGHAQQAILDAKAQLNHRQETEQLLLGKLESAGLSEDAGLLGRLLEARDAILKRFEAADVNQEISAPTLKLVSQISSSALHRSEELLDLSRRLDDPLLEAPKGAARSVEDCRADLVRAYRAVADSRTRLLLYKELSPEDFLDDSARKPGRGLGTLAAQLEEETQVLQGVDRRLRGLEEEIPALGAEGEGSESGSTSAQLESES